MTMGFEIPADADDKVRQAVADQRETYRNFGTSEVLESTRIHTRGSQQFAVFPYDARELIDEDRAGDDGVVIRPALLDGTAFLFLPDEGQTGVLHWMYAPKVGRTWLAWLKVGWIRHAELDASPEEIARNIADEVDAGANHYTGIQEH